MATKGINPFAAFQKAKGKSDGDVETKAETKKYGKEGSKKEEAFDKTEMKKGGGVKKFARGGGVETKGKTRGKIC